MLITYEEIAHIIGCPLENVIRYYPLILDYMQKKNRNTVFFQVAILATIGVECGTFKPVREWYPPNWSEARARKYFNDKYSNRKDLGNRGGNDGWVYRGAGFIQLTGRDNFIKYGKKIGVDLATFPDKALEDKNAVAILIEFAIDHGLDVWAERAFNTSDNYGEDESWHKIRKQVNGGYTHYDKFAKFVTAFKEAAKD